MLNPNIREMLNRQVAKELYSAYLYLDMSNYYAHKNLNGFANWFKVQAKEEYDHAELFSTYLLNNGESVELEQIPKPDKTYENYAAPIQAALEHERFVTASIHEIYGAAAEAKDFRTTQFLDWFVAEQGEEEKNAEELLGKFELFATDGKGLYLLDQELAARVYTAPSLQL